MILPFVLKIAIVTSRSYALSTSLLYGFVGMWLREIVECWYFLTALLMVFLMQLLSCKCSLYLFQRFYFPVNPLFLRFIYILNCSFWDSFESIFGVTKLLSILTVQTFGHIFLQRILNQGDSVKNQTKKSRRSFPDKSKAWTH